MRDNTWFLMHDEPNASLGWRATGTQAWNIASNGSPINPASGTESIELLAARIGWESHLTRHVFTPSSAGVQSHLESESEVFSPESSKVNEPGS